MVKDSLRRKRKLELQALEEEMSTISKRFCALQKQQELAKQKQEEEATEADNSGKHISSPS